eukprot:14410176-Alexandrium_andersonii.AAC.1
MGLPHANSTGFRRLRTGRLRIGRLRIGVLGVFRDFRGFRPPFMPVFVDRFGICVAHCAEPSGASGINFEA